MPAVTISALDFASRCVFVILFTCFTRENPELSVILVFVPSTNGADSALVPSDPADTIGDTLSFSP